MCYYIHILHIYVCIHISIVRHNLTLVTTFSVFEGRSTGNTWMEPGRPACRSGFHTHQMIDLTSCRLSGCFEPRVHHLHDEDN